MAATNKMRLRTIAIVVPACSRTAIYLDRTLRSRTDRLTHTMCKMHRPTSRTTITNKRICSERFERHLSCYSGGCFHNRRAFDRLVVKYQSPIRRFFLSQTLGDKQLSDDLAQDTFIKAYVNITKFRGLAAFSTWLYKIAYNVLLDYRRRSKTTCDIDGVPGMKTRTVAADGNLKMDIYDALARLNDNERSCLSLQLIDGYQINRIAEITGMAEGTVKSHISRGKKKLSNFLKQNGYD